MPWRKSGTVQARTLLAPIEGVAPFLDCAI
jgi:hypothetical protein